MSNTSIERTQKLQNSKAAIAWIKSMGASGYVFVARGDPTKIEEYAMRRDEKFENDTPKFIALVRKIPRFNKW